MPTKIPYVDESINPIRTKSGGWHCVKQSTGCLHCYAEKINKRFGDKLAFYDLPNRKVKLILNQKALEKPLHWKRPKKIFVQDMSDLFLDDVPFEFIDRVLEVIIRNHRHKFMVLTKRPKRMREYFHGLIENTEGTYRRVTKSVINYDRCHGAFLRLRRKQTINNLWLGVTTENQEMADKRIPTLLQIPAAKRFVSVEPMLGQIQLYGKLIGHLNAYPAGGGWFTKSNKLDWVICGGENGPGARPMHPDWVRSIRDQCVEASIPFFFKQWGEWKPTENMEIENYKSLREGQMRVMKNAVVYQTGKKAAGRKLDGKIWDQMPGGMT